MLVEHKEFQEKDGSIGYIESVFESDNVLKCTYFPNTQRLYIAFSRGDTYSYANVTMEMYLDFEAAQSQGKWFFRKLNKNQAHPYRKEFTLYPSEVRDLKEIVKTNKPVIEEQQEEDSNDE